MLGPALTLVDRNFVLFENRRLIYFGGTDYHRLSSHPPVVAALNAAAHQFGISSSGSRATTGNHPLHEELEAKVAAFFDSEASLVVPAGYLANMVLLQGIAGEYDVFLVDENAHTSIVDAARLFDKPLVYFYHCDAADLDSRLNTHLKPGDRPLIMTDGVFAATGKIPPLAKYAGIAAARNGKILVDDAHAMATIGDSGKGSWEHAGIDRDLCYQTGTLSKGFGTCGGVILGSARRMKDLHKKSAAFIGSSGLTLPLAAAAIASIDYLRQHRELITGLQQRSLQCKQTICEMGFDVVPSPSPVLAITRGDKRKNDRLYHHLLEKGIFPSFIEYPGGAPGGYFRFALSSLHSEEQIALLSQAIQSAI